jgi:hypothetical protein
MCDPDDEVNSSKTHVF